MGQRQRALKLEGRRALVVGLARSGVAAANVLLRRGCTVTVTDRESADRLAPRIAELEGPVRLLLGKHPLEEFLASDFIVLSPGVPSSLPEIEAARSEGTPVLSEVELAFQNLPGRYIAITGSNGKTTTTTLLGQIVERAGFHAATAGNIGLPLSRLLLSGAPPDPRTLVVELSSFQLESIDTFRPEIAVLLNLTPDHLDRYSSFEAYRAAKLRIFENQTPSDWAVLNADDPELGSAAPPSRVARFSATQRTEEGAFVAGGSVYTRLQGRESRVMPVSDILIQGRHNLENVLAATLAARLAGVEAEAIRETVARFRGVEHRLEFVAEIKGVRYFNDSKATNVASAARALESFDSPVVAIMGGLDKRGDFSVLRPILSERVKMVIAIGSAARKISETLSGTVPVMHAAGLEDAVLEASRVAAAGEVVLLAPACASFDMFQDYEHRGRTFKEVVLTLEGLDSLQGDLAQ